MSERIITLTPQILRTIILEEKRKIRQEKMKEAEEIDADEYADSLESPKVHTPKNESLKRNDREEYKTLNVQEHRLMAQLQQIRESKRRIRARLLRH